MPWSSILRKRTYWVNVFVLSNRSWKVLSLSIIENVIEMNPFYKYGFYV